MEGNISQGGGCCESSSEAAGWHEGRCKGRGRAESTGYFFAQIYVGESAVKTRRQEAAAGQQRRWGLVPREAGASPSDRKPDGKGGCLGRGMVYKSPFACLACDPMNPLTPHHSGAAR